MNTKPNYVYILDVNGNPLMPTRRFGKVRRMLRDGLAKIVHRDVFTIQLLYEPKTHFVDDLTLDCDAGDNRIGLSVSSSDKEYFAEDIIVDKPKVENNRKRRNRKVRNDNRKSSKEAQAAEHRRQKQEKKINLLCSILPIKNVHNEITKD